MSHLTLHVRIRRSQLFPVRMWIGFQLIRLAAWVMWMPVRFWTEDCSLEDEEDELECSQ
jgi:hypothetical protein